MTTALATSLARDVVGSCSGVVVVVVGGGALVVVAPRAGGPATYLDDGRTGVLVDGTSIDAIRAGIHRARELAGVPGRAGAARARVLGEMTIERMAGRLVDLYQRALVAEPVAAAAAGA